MRYPTILHLCFVIWATWQLREKTWHKCKAAGRLANADRVLLPCYSRAWRTLRAWWQTLEIDDDRQSTAAGRRTLCQEGLFGKKPSMNITGEQCSTVFLKKRSPRWQPAAYWIQVPGNDGDLDARELATRRRENAAKKKRAQPKARDQIRRGRKVATNMIGSTILVFAKSIMSNTWKWPFFTCHIVLGVGKLQQMANKKY